MTPNQHVFLHNASGILVIATFICGLISVFAAVETGKARWLLIPVVLAVLAFVCGYLGAGN